MSPSHKQPMQEDLRGLPWAEAEVPAKTTLRKYKLCNAKEASAGQTAQQRAESRKERGETEGWRIEHYGMPIA